MAPISAGVDAEQAEDETTDHGTDDADHDVAKQTKATPSHTRMPASQRSMNGMRALQPQTLKRCALESLAQSLSKGSAPNPRFALRRRSLTVKSGSPAARYVIERRTVRGLSMFLS